MAVINDINTEVMTTDDNCFEKARLNELNNWKVNVYEEILHNEQKLVHEKWKKLTTNEYKKLDLLLKILKNQQKMKY